MMRILFIVAQTPLAPHGRGGSSAVFYEQHAALVDLGHNVHLWHYAYPHKRAQFDAFVAEAADIWAGVQSASASVHLTTIPYPPRFLDRAWNFVANRVRGETVLFPSLRTVGFRQMRSLIAEIEPDLIWAAQFWPAQLAVLQARIPIVYAHDDWLYRIKALRFGRAEDARMRRAEETVARQAHVVVSGSQKECADLRELGCRHVHYLPVSYEPVGLKLTSPPLPPRLVHLGGLATTATQQGLARFLAVVWPEFRADAPPFWIVGDNTAAPPSLAEQLAGLTTTGYVPDLESVLRPYDLHLIPWEHSTGQRTRLPVAFNFGQVVVAVRAGVAGFPEAQDGVNCRLVDRIEAMAPVIRELMADSEQRIRLGRAARETFVRHFTRPALLPRYEAVLASLAPAAA